MVGIDKLRDYLGGYNTNYVIIGGTACNLNLEAADLQGRATKDIDMIVVCEAINADYLHQFWAFIKAGGYMVYQIKSEDSMKPGYYRFIKPTDSSFPPCIELFSRAPDNIQIPENAYLVRIETYEDYLSGFSVILIDNDYYYYAVGRSREIAGLQVLEKDALVILKAKAYINNRKRKEEVRQGHQDDIDKHKKDIYRLSFLFSGEERYDVPDVIKTDLKEFLAKLQTDSISTKAIARAMKVSEVSMPNFIQKIEIMYQL